MLDPDNLDGVTHRLGQVCSNLAAELTGMGVAISLMSADGPFGVAAASDEASRAADELQFAAGEGPCHDAYAARRPVLTPDLRGTGGARWPGFTSMALSSGVAAVFAFPLHVGAAGFGVMDVFSDTAGSLSLPQQNRALTYAKMAVGILLDGDVVTAAGHLDGGLSDALDGRAEIHQAQGMTMVDLAVGPAEALTRMRAHAFAHGKPLAELAREIIDGYSLAQEG
nr:hypothetical protein [Aeromicrobium sp.]